MQTRLAIGERRHDRVGELLGPERGVRSAANVEPAGHRHHVVKGRNRAIEAGQGGREHGVGVHDRTGFGVARDRCPDAGATRSTAASGRPGRGRGPSRRCPRAPSRRRRAPDGVTRNPSWVLTLRLPDLPWLIPRAFIRRAWSHSDRRSSSSLSTSRRLPDSGRARSGNRPEMPARDAAHTPRSVMSPVTRRAGVTSKPKLRTTAPKGKTWTDSARPLDARPETWVISTAARSSMGICVPSSRLQSMLDEGAAT